MRGPFEARKITAEDGDLFVVVDTRFKPPRSVDQTTDPTLALVKADKYNDTFFRQTKIRGLRGKNSGAGPLDRP